jgi:hypothetical protein
MDAGELDKLTWIPEKDRDELKQKMKEWTDPGKGYVLIVSPPAPGREGYTLFQPCVDPEAQRGPG